MKIAALGLIATLAAVTPALAQDPWAMPGEVAVDAYSPSNANAGATPFEGSEMFDAFKGRDGIDRIVETFVERNFADPVIGEIFVAHDKARIKRTLKEQFCYILGGGCDYSGRDMKSSHKDLGLQASDMNVLVENLQFAMDREGVPFAAQNRFLAKLAPMKRDMSIR